MVDSQVSSNRPLAKRAKPRYTLEQLLALCVPDNRHNEPWLDRTPVGRELPRSVPARRAKRAKP